MTLTKHRKSYYQRGHGIKLSVFYLELSFDENVEKETLDFVELWLPLLDMYYNVQLVWEIYGKRSEFAGEYGSPSSKCLQVRLLNKDGSSRFFRETPQPRRDPRGQMFLCLFLDMG